tara:strand:+ start:1677 stop:1904 length:228 start_codon:yes stop_codon:yes gene_type:complete
MTHMELKTLEDIEHSRVSTGRSVGKTGAKDVSCMLLRQEAIKWVKKNSHKDWCIDCHEWSMRKFFNITEEELENE